MALNSIYATAKMIDHTIYAEATQTRPAALISKDGQLLVASVVNGSWQTFAPEGEKTHLVAQQILFDKPLGIQYSTTCMALSLDKQFIYTGTNDGRICIWTDDGEFLKAYPLHQNPIEMIFALTDDRIASVAGVKASVEKKDFNYFLNEGTQLVNPSKSFEILRIDLKNGEITQNIHTHEEASSILINPDGSKVLIGHKTGHLKEISFENYHDIKRLIERISCPIIGIAVSKDWESRAINHFNSSVDKHFSTLIFWNIPHGSQLDKFTHFPTSHVITAMQVTLEEFLITSSADFSVCVWAMKQQTLIREIPWLEIAVEPRPLRAALAISEDGLTIFHISSSHRLVTTVSFIIEDLIASDGDEFSPEMMVPLTN